MYSKHWQKYYISIYHLFISLSIFNLFDKQRYREIQAEKKNLLSADSVPKDLTTARAEPGLKLGVQNSTQVSHIGGRNSRMLALICCLPGIAVAGQRDAGLESGGVGPGTIRGHRICVS